MDISKNKVEEIKTIFKTMDYGKVQQNISLALEWINILKTLGCIPVVPTSKVSPITNLIDNKNIATCSVITDESEFGDLIEIQTNVLPASERAKILYKISGIFKQFEELICQLNLITQSVVVADTKQTDIPLMINYFQYYGGWADLIQSDLNEWEPYGEIGLVINSTCSICVVLMMLAPMLSAGNKVWLILLKPQMQPLIHLMIDIFKRAGLPSETVNVMVTTKLEIAKSFCKKLSKVSVIGDMKNTENLLDSFPFKTLSSMYGSKTSMLVFSDADLDSACVTIAENVWKNSGKLPWALNTVYLQESIYETFIEKLKNRLNKISNGALSDKLSNIHIDAKTISQVQELKKNNIEIHETKSNIFITVGNFCQMHKNLPVINLIPFRTAVEGIALANNNYYGTALSIWTTNCSLALEIVKDVQVGIVWINTHGELDASLPLCLRKCSGQGYFGGKEALLLYMKHKNHNLPKLLLKSSDQKSINKEEIDKLNIHKQVQSSIKASQSWSKKSVSDRNGILRKIADEIGKSSIGNSKDWTSSLYEWSSRSQTVNLITPSIAYEPRGLIIFDTKVCRSTVQLISAALALGNGLIIVSKDKEFIETLKLMKTCGIPSDVICLIQPKIDGIVEMLLSHQEVQTYWKNAIEVTENNIVNAHPFLNTFLFTDDTIITNEIAFLIAVNTKCVIPSVGETISA